MYQTSACMGSCLTVIEVIAGPPDSEIKDEEEEED